MTRRAIEILDADGLDGLSMRRLAAEFGATVGSLYWYVANKDELLELALDEVLAEARPPQDDDPGAARDDRRAARDDDRPGTSGDRPAAQDDGWRGALAGYARAQRAMLLRHPWALGLMGRIPNMGPNALALSEQVLGVLQRAGVPALADALAAVNDYVIGAVMAQTSWQSVVELTGTRPGDWRDYLGAMASRHPLLAAQPPDGEMSDVADVADVADVSDRRFEFALSALLDGLATAAPP
jgi:AcrR family transcriptional regulator